MRRETVDGSAPGALARLRDRLRANFRPKTLVSPMGVAIVFLALTTFMHISLGSGHWTVDLCTKLLSKRPQTQDGRIALVYVSEKTLASYAYLSPTDRQLLADLVRAVDAAGAAVIGFDFIIDRPTEPAKDDALMVALREAKAKVVVGVIDEPPTQGKRKSFQASYLEKVKREIGHLYFDAKYNTLVISDDAVRSMAGPAETHDHRTSFARRIVGAVGSYPELKSSYIAWLREPRDGSETFQSLPAEQVLRREGAPLPIAEMLKGKIVLIGGNFVNGDRHLTPLSVMSYERYPGLFIHAQIIAQMLDGRSIITLSWYWQLALLALAGLFGLWLGFRQRRVLLGPGLPSLVGLVLAGVVAFSYADLILPCTGMLLAWLLGLAVGRFARPPDQPAEA